MLKVQLKKNLIDGQSPLKISIHSLLIHPSTWLTNPSIHTYKRHSMLTTIFSRTVVENSIWPTVMLKETVIMNGATLLYLSWIYKNENQKCPHNYYKGAKSRQNCVTLYFGYHTVQMAPWKSSILCYLKLILRVSGNNKHLVWQVWMPLVL